MCDVIREKDILKNLLEINSHRHRFRIECEKVMKHEIKGEITSNFRIARNVIKLFVTFDTFNIDRKQMPVVPITSNQHKLLIIGKRTEFR